MSDAPERKPLIRERTPGRNFDIFQASEVVDVYADGTGRLFIGPQVTKIEFTRVVNTVQEVIDGTPTIIDEREVFCRLSMPTAAIVEACTILIEQMGSNFKALDDAQTNLKQVIINAIKRAGAVKL